MGVEDTAKKDILSHSHHVRLTVGLPGSSPQGSASYPLCGAGPLRMSERERPLPEAHIILKFFTLTPRVCRLPDAH